MKKSSTIFCLLLAGGFGYSVLTAAAVKMQFDRFTTDQGLSQNTVNCLYLDRRGFLWIGTQDGLNKYDGYQFTVYRNDPAEPNSLSDNFIRCIFEDSLGVLWIGTEGGGLNLFFPDEQKFISFRHDPEDPGSIGHNSIWSIFQDRQGMIWIATNGAGLNQVISPPHLKSAEVASDVTRIEFIRYPVADAGKNGLSHSFVYCIVEDDSGNLWIGTENGLNKYDRSLQKFDHFFHDHRNSTSLSHDRVWSLLYDRHQQLWIGTEKGLDRFDDQSHTFNHYLPDIQQAAGRDGYGVWSLLEDRRGDLWVGTIQSGLCRIQRGTGQVINFQNDPIDRKSLSANEITSLVEDHSGILWIGSWGGGLNKLNPRKNVFRNYSYLDGTSSGLSDNHVWSIGGDSTGNIWVTTDKGLNRLDRNTNIFLHIRHIPGHKNSLNSDYTWSMFSDRHGRLWIGTYGSGLNRYDPVTGEFAHFMHDPKIPGTLSSDHVSCIIEDSLGFLWVGTYGGGLNRFERSTGQFECYRHLSSDPASIGHDDIAALYVDRRGKLWVGTDGGGLHRYNDSRKSFQKYTHRPPDPLSISDDRIFCIHEDTLGNFWIGTGGGGLNYFDRSREIFTRFTTTDGLPNNVVYGILPDRSGNLWLSTNLGLSKFNPANKTFQNFTKVDGLPGNEFNSGAYYADRNGYLYFGGPDGITVFHPDSIRQNPFIPPIVLTGFRIFNKPVSFSQDLNRLSELRLSHNDYLFSLEFTALDFSAPEKNKYAYKMDGLDDDWIMTDARMRFATYTNLDPGQYVFRVKGSNSDGIWNETGTSLKIIITPPFWKTWWFRAIMVIGLIQLAFLLHFNRIRHLQQRRKAQEEFSARLIESQEKERQRIASELHDSLGQNLLIINNELLQLSQTNRLREEELEHLTSTIQESIDEVREISRNLHPHLLDRLGLKKAIVSVVKKVSHAREINFNLEIGEIDHLLPPASEIHFYRIIQEGINNIIKHSAASQARIEIKETKDSLLTVIEDHGVGFDLKASRPGKKSSIGLGLSGIEERVRLLGGKWQIESKPRQGTRLTIQVPLNPIS